MSVFLLFIVGYACLGAMVGLMSGLLGIGGGIIMVPCLTMLLPLQGVPWSELFPIVVATSLGVIGLTSSISLFCYIRSGHEIWSIYSRLAFGVVLGVLFGVLMGYTLSAATLKVVFACFLFMIALILWRDYQPVPERHLPSRLGLSSVFFLVGLKSGLLGVGGGMITTPYLLYCNVPIRRAFAVACSVSATVALVSMVAFALRAYTVDHMIVPYTWGYIFMPAFIGMSVVSPLTVRLGVNYAHHFSTLTLKRILACFLIVACLDMWLS